MGLVTSGKLETFLVGVGSHGVFFTGQGMLAGAQGGRHPKPPPDDATVG